MFDIMQSEVNPSVTTDHTFFVKHALFLIKFRFNVYIPSGNVLLANEGLPLFNITTLHLREHIK